MKYLASVLVVLVTLYLGLVRQAFAFEVPQFTSCVNPQGQLKVNYDSGTHGIAGQTGNYQGRDAVYTLSGDALTQCFCADNGTGIQTNWWKVSSLTEQEIEILKSQGWQYIPNGALWGLDNAPYLAFNSEYICKSSGGFTPTTDIPGPGGGGGQGGSVLGISIGSVLGLASTGNSKFLYGVLLSSIISLLAGAYLKKRVKTISK